MTEEQQKKIIREWALHRDAWDEFEEGLRTAWNYVVRILWPTVDWNAVHDEVSSWPIAYSDAYFARVEETMRKHARGGL